MAVLYNGAVEQYIKWTTPTNAVGLTTKTVSKWYKPLALPGATLWTIYDGTGTDSDEYNLMLSVSDGKLRWLAHFSTTNGVWNSTNAVFSANNLYHIAISYNGSDTANNPTFYINGVSIAVTRSTAPVGTYRNGTSTDLFVGPVGLLTPNHYSQDVRVYNRILTAAEIAALYASSRTLEMNDSGLVFHAPLMYAANRYSTLPFSGTLGATDYTYDRINGYQGTPTGSPTGAADIVYGTSF